MAIKSGAVHRNIFFLDKIVEMTAKLLARTLPHLRANADGKMVGAREGPEITLEFFQEFHLDDVFFGGDEIAERELQIVGVSAVVSGSN